MKLNKFESLSVNCLHKYIIIDVDVFTKHSVERCKTKLKKFMGVKIV